MKTITEEIRLPLDSKLVCEYSYVDPDPPGKFPPFSDSSLLPAVDMKIKYHGELIGYASTNVFTLHEYPKDSKEDGRDVFYWTTNSAGVKSCVSRFREKTLAQSLGMAQEACRKVAEALEAKLTVKQEALKERYESIRSAEAVNPFL